MKESYVVMYDSLPPFVAQGEAMQDLDFNMYPEKVVMEWDQYDPVD